MHSLFCYTARDNRGALVRGSIQAGGHSAALAALRSRALCVTSLQPAAGIRGNIVAALYGASVSQKSLVTFFRSFATLVRAGVPMRRCLDVTVEQCSDARLREALRSTLCGLENGIALSEAMARHPKEFPAIYTAMIRAGELGGVLDDVLERIASLLERERAARKRVYAALTYPAIVSCAALALIAFLLTSIVPTFRTLYEQMHVPLPAITSALIATGTFLRAPVCWASLLAGGLFAGFAISRVRVMERGAAFVESAVSSVPALGTIVKKSAVARLSRMLGTLLRCGVPLVPALDVVADVVSSPRYRASVADLRRALREGSSVSEPLAQSGLYESMFVQMVRVGEETGTLDVMLLRAAEYYELDVEMLLSTLGSTLEPAMILFLGAAVGFIVAAIFIPLYTLIGSIK